MADDDKDWQDVPSKKGGGAATATADSEWEDVPSESSAPAVKPEEKEPTFLEKAERGTNLTGSEGKLGLWDVVKHGLNPLAIPGDVSELAGKASDWYREKAKQKEQEELGNIASGGKPSNAYVSPRAGYDLLGRVTGTASGLTSPESVAIGGAAVAAPEIVGPALIAHGGLGAIKSGEDIAEKGFNPENVEQGLGSLAEATGGGAALAEIPKMGGLKNTLTAKAAQSGLKATGGAGLGLGLPAEDLITKAVRPRARAQGWQEAMESPGVQRAIKEADAAHPIQNIEDFHDAVGPMKEKLWDTKVQPALDRQGPRPVDMKPAAQAVRDAITPTMREFNPTGVAALEDLAGKLERSRTVAEANELQKYANSQLEVYHAKYPTARRAAMNSNPDTIGWETARRAIREQLNSTLENAGETQTAEARKDYGHLTAIEKELERKVNPNERKAPINLARTLGLIGAIPTHGASILAGEVISHMNDPNVLLRRGISKMNPPAEAPFTPPPKFTPPAAPAQIPRIAGQQMPLNLPPENLPLFNIPVGTPRPPAAPTELPNMAAPKPEPPAPTTLPPIGGPGREGILGRIGGEVAPTPQPQVVEPGAALGSIPQRTTPREEFKRPEVSTELKTGSRVAGKDGDTATLKTPSRDFPVKYRVVEAADLVASHDPRTFAKNPDYPAGVQERAYHSSPEAQNRVAQQAQNYDPSFTVNTNPDAVNGPPIVTQDGIVLGGNSRAMSTKRLYSDGGGDIYKNRLLRDANSFGLNPEDIKGMKEPVLVREMTEPITDRENMRKIGADLNRSFTGALGTSEKAVSAGKSISQGTLERISGLLNRGDEQINLREAMRQDPRSFIDSLVSDGVITERERPQYIDNTTGGLNEEGKNFIERALLGSVLDDTRILDSASKSDTNKIEGSLSDFSQLMARQDEWDITPLVREALLERARMNARGLTADDLTRQGDMFGPVERNHSVDAMIRAFDKKPKELRAAIKQFADDARHDVKGQATMSFAQPPEAWKSFNEAFDTHFTEKEYHEDLRNVLKEEAGHGQTETGNQGIAQEAPREENRASAGTKQETKLVPLSKISETKSVAPAPVEKVRLPHPEAVDLKPGEATSDRFYNKETDEWTPEREANHDAVADAAIKGKTPPTDRPPEAIITMGGTASGKTTLTRQILGADTNRVNIDSDTNKLSIPEYEGLKDSDPDNAAARVHEESKAISRRTIQKAVQKGLDFIYDTSTGGGGEKLFKKLKDLGYNVRVVYADVPVEEAIKRAEERAKSSEDPSNRDRIVPEDVIRQKHVEAAKAFNTLRNSPHVDEVRAFDTTARTPEEFYNRKGEKETVHNQKTLDRIKEKANGKATVAK